MVPIQTHLFYSSINRSGHEFQAGGNHVCVFSRDRSVALQLTRILQKRATS